MTDAFMFGVLFGAFVGWLARDAWHRRNEQLLEWDDAKVELPKNVRIK